MLDLKAKLASAGLITEADIARAEKSKKAKGEPRRKQDPPRDDQAIPVTKLQGKPKSEIYDTIRKWVEHYRLDKTGGVPTESSQAYHFAQANGRVGRLTLEPEALEQLQDGRAGLVAYMSHHGLAHAVVPAATARSLAEVYPLWLRVLKGDSRAGAVEGDSVAQQEPSRVKP